MGRQTKKLTNKRPKVRPPFQSSWCSSSLCQENVLSHRIFPSLVKIMLKLKFFCPYYKLIGYLLFFLLESYIKHKTSHGSAASLKSRGIEKHFASLHLPKRFCKGAHYQDFLSPKARLLVKTCWHLTVQSALDLTQMSKQVWTRIPWRQSETAKP